MITKAEKKMENVLVTCLESWLKLKVLISLPLAWNSVQCMYETEGTYWVVAREHTEWLLGNYTSTHDQLIHYKYTVHRLKPHPHTLACLRFSRPFVISLFYPFLGDGIEANTTHTHTHTHPRTTHPHTTQHTQCQCLTHNLNVEWVGVPRQCFPVQSCDGSLSIWGKHVLHVYGTQ